MPLGMREWYYRRLVKAKKEENENIKKASSKASKYTRAK